MLQTYLPRGMLDGGLYELMAYAVPPSFGSTVRCFIAYFGKVEMLGSQG